MTNPQSIISWLKFLDVEYLDDECCEALAALDINNPADQTKIIHLAMRGEVNRLNDISRTSMKKILDEVEGYPEIAVRQVIERVGMPFAESLNDYKTFFRQVREELFPGD